MIYIFLGVWAAVIGSFLNMLIYRLPLEEDIVWRRSHCPKCSTPLTVMQLIPLFGYLFQKGKCKHCQYNISSRYFWVEVLSVFFTILLFQTFGFGALFAKYLIFTYAMILLFFTDLETFILPDVVTYPIIILGLIINATNGNTMDSVYGAAIGFSIFFLIGLLGKLIYKKDVMGYGDVKLAAGIGAYWGVTAALVSSYLSFIIGGVAGIVLILAKIKNRHDMIPFGPAIILGILGHLIGGDILVRWAFGAL